MPMTTDARQRVTRLRQMSSADDSQDLEALLEVAKALHSTLDVGQLLGLVVEKAVALTGADRGCLVTVGDQGGYQVEIVA